MTEHSVTKRRMSTADLQALRGAWEKLELPSLAARLTSIVGKPVEEGLSKLPPFWHERIYSATEISMLRILGTAVATLASDDNRPSNERFHKIVGIGTGAIGGFFGLPGVLLELPVTTGIIMRSIAEIAASEGEDLSEPASRMACVEVFALGGPHHDDDAAETGYFSIRMALAIHFSLVSQQLIDQGAVRQGLPVMVNLARAVAARFGIAVSDKIAFQMVPVLGAAGGAIINAIFVQHFQDMARGHFTVRRLERTYGHDAVRRAYERVDRQAAQQREPVLRMVE